MSQREPLNGGTASRVARLESYLESLTKTVTTLTEAMNEQGREMARGLDRLGVKIDDIRKEVSQGGRPDWMVLLTGAAVIITFTSLMGSRALAPLEVGLSHVQAESQRALDWEQRYQEGLIPSNALKDISRLHEELTGYIKQATENEVFIWKADRHQERRLDHVEGSLSQMRERYAYHLGLGDVPRRSAGTPVEPR